MALGFDLPRSFAVGNGPEGIAVGDLNRDGKVDLAIGSINPSATSLSILLGNGDGTFQAARSVAVGARPPQLRAGDFNADGRLDLIATTDFGGGVPLTAVAVLLGLGDGSFQAPRSFATGNQPSRMELADFNGDGKLDAAVAGGPTGNNVAVLLGNGDGTLQAPRSATTGGQLPFEMGIADFNRDGKLDIAVINALGGLALLLGNGDGTFRSTTAAPASNPSDLAVGDFNRDGNPDVAIANIGDRTLAIFLGNGDGTLRAQGTIGLASVPLHMVASDLDGDGKLDLAIAQQNSAGNTIAIFLGNGDGSFQTPPFVLAGSGPSDLVAADVNGDGRPDLITTDNNRDIVTVFLNNGGAAATPSIAPVIQFDITTLTGTFPLPSPYAGPVGYLQQQYLYAGNDSLLLYVTQPNIWVRLGAGNDAISGPAGRNIIDAGGGSNFITGGAGQNTYYLDARLGQTTWNTITDFRPGEDVTLWGYDVRSNSSAAFTGIDGASQYQGATLRATVGGASVALTFAGMDMGTAAGLQLVGGTSTEGAPYLHIVF